MMVSDGIWSCHVLSCLVMSCHVLSCLVMSCNVLSCFMWHWRFHNYTSSYVIIRYFEHFWVQWDVDPQVLRTCLNHIISAVTVREADESWVQALEAGTECNVSDISWWNFCGFVLWWANKHTSFNTNPHILPPRFLRALLTNSLSIFKYCSGKTAAKANLNSRAEKEGDVTRPWTKSP